MATDPVRDRLAKLIGDALQWRDNPSPMTILQFIWPEIEKLITDVIASTVDLEPMDEHGRPADRDWEAINEANAQALHYKAKHDRLMVLVNERILDLYELAKHGETQGEYLCAHSYLDSTCPRCWSREIRRFATHTLQRIAKLNP